MAQLPDRLLTALIEAQKEIQEGLVVTPASSLDEYNRRVGKHMGLGMALDILTKLMRGDEQDDN